MPLTSRTKTRDNYDWTESSSLRFWITKNSQLSVREQLVRQVVLAILSEDLAPGQKLPSIRAIARRCRIHSNTVSAAYHQLLDQGWLELRRGSGLYVRSQPASAADGSSLDTLLQSMLRAARNQGYEPAQVLDRLARIVTPRALSRVLVAESDEGMREILMAEIGEQLAAPVEAADLAVIPPDALIVSLPSRAAAVRSRLPNGASFVTLRLRSVRRALERETMPSRNAIVAIVSRSPEFRQWALAMLIAVGLEPACLCEVDTALDGWHDRARAGALVIADVVAAGNLPEGCETRIFRVIADASIAEMKQLCGL